MNFLKGDATDPKTDGSLIVHVCNNAGGWGAGFVLAISKRWREPEQAYRKWAVNGVDPDAGEFKLGNVQYVACPGPRAIWVANMVAQDGFGAMGRIPLQYDALKQCLALVGRTARSKNLSVHMPRIGCGLAGGSWDKVEPIVEAALEGVHVYVYDLP